MMLGIVCSAVDRWMKVLEIFWKNICEDKFEKKFRKKLTAFDYIYLYIFILHEFYLDSRYMS